MDRGTFIDVTDAERTTLGEIVNRYMREVTPTMCSAHDDLIRLRALQRHPICKLSMTTLSAARVAAFRDERLRSVQSATVIRELAYLSSINHARRQWEINIGNPVALVRSRPRRRAASEFWTNDAMRVLPVITASWVTQQFGRCVKAAGLEGRLQDLRHTFYSHLVMNGVDLRTVQKLAGHSSMKVTERYAHLAPEHLKNMTSKINL
jgi:hypothetical protein